MARFVLVTVLAAALASAASAVMLPNQAFCDSTGQVKLIANGWFMGLWTQRDSTDCHKLYRYDTDMWGNVTLSELDEYDCYYPEASATWMRYDEVTTTVTASLRLSSSTTAEVTLKPGLCTSSGLTGAVTTGRYCGPNNNNFIAQNRDFLWVLPDAGTAGGYCVQSGYYSTTYYQSTLDISYVASWCVNTPSFSRQWYDGSTEMWLRYSQFSLTQSVVLNSTACNAPSASLPAWVPYCVDSNAANSDYQNAMILATNATSWVMTMPNSGRSIMCRRTGNYSTLGALTSMNTSYGDDTCSGWISYGLLGSKFYSSNNTWILQDSNNNWFSASQCTSTGLTSGTYCGGWNAKLVIGGSNQFVLWSDWTATKPQCRIFGRWRWTTGGAVVDRIDSDCGASVNNFNVDGNTVYVTFTRGSSYGGNMEGYAFQMGFCGSNSTTPTPAAVVPSGKLCMNAGGADGVMLMENGTFVMTLNNSWVGYLAPCAYVGHAVHRDGAVSYDVALARCKGSSYYTPDITIYNMSYMDGQITFILGNSTANTTVTTTTCPTNQASLLSGSEYCPAPNPYADRPWPATTFASKMWVQGEMLYYVSGFTNCFIVGQMTGRTGSKVWVNSQIDSCPAAASKQFTVLDNGDLYFYNSYNNGGAGVLSTSFCSATTGWTVSGAYCGVAAASSGTTSAPGPAPAPTNMTVSQAVGSTLGAPMGAKVSLSITSYGMFMLAIEPDGSDPCVAFGGVEVTPTAIGYGVHRSSSACSSWQAILILRDATSGALTVTLQQDSYAPVNVSMAANSSCTASEAGVKSGEYCGGWGQAGSSNALMPHYAAVPVGVAGRLMLWLDTQQTRWVVTNFTTTGTNVTMVNNFWWYTTSGSTYTYTTMPSDRYINTVGTTGLSISGSQFSWAFNSATCGVQTALAAPQILASTPITALGGAITGLFLDGTFAIQFNGTSANPSTQPCFLGGTYLTVGSQLTLMTNLKNTYYCGSYPEVSRAWVAADGSVSFDLWFGGASYDIALTFANCSGGTSGVPAGQLCRNSWTDAWICHDRFIATTWSAPVLINNAWTPMLSIMGVGALYGSPNGTVTVYATASGYPFSLQLQQTSALIYNANGKVAWHFDWQGKFVDWLSSDSAMCRGSWRGNDQQLPLVGAYCGYTPSGSNVTLVALPSGAYYLRYLPQGMTSWCQMTGLISYSKQTSFVSFEATQFSNNCLFGNSYIGGGRLIPTGGQYFNGSIKFDLWGNYYTTAGAAGAGTFKYTLEAGNCGGLASAPVSPLLHNLPTGVYNLSAPNAWMNATTVVLGSQYAMFVYRNSNSRTVPSTWSVTAGTYSALTLPLQGSGPVLTQPTTMYTFGSGSSYAVLYNSTFTRTTQVLNVMLNFPGGGGDGMTTLPMVYQGSTPAYSAASASPENKAAEEKKTAVIIGVIIAVVAVLAIIAVVVAKSRGGSQPASQPGGQDYRPMNSV